jgi:methyltransferase family protein
MLAGMICRLCSAEAAPFGAALVLRRLQVAYFECPGCGLVQTEKPYWLDEAYAEAISSSDVGIVSRNLSLIRTTSLVIRAFFNPAGRFIDYGAGTGLLVRAMRDSGYDFRYFDRYAKNVFARGFEAADEEQYDLLTAFEVLEHLPDPMQGIADMLRRSKNVLLTTELLPSHKPPPGQWWYYALESGQHVSIYSRRSLAYIASRSGLHLTSHGSVHLMSQKPVHPRVFRFMLSSRWAERVLRRRAPRRGLIPSDFKQITGRSLD